MALRDQLHVMVVDDMSTCRGLILQALDGFGVRNVRHAADGPSALQSLAERITAAMRSELRDPRVEVYRVSAPPCTE